VRDDPTAPIDHTFEYVFEAAFEAGASSESGPGEWWRSSGSEVPAWWRGSDVVA